ncbi:MAG: polysaccharide pyruvyl transferase family protein [Actinomycetota bacterium]
MNALSEAVLHSVAAHRPDARVLVFDNGRGRRSSPSQASVEHSRDGAWISRRLHRSESLWAMRVSSALRVLPNRNVSAMRRAAAILDISGGDSFTDLYGIPRWNLVVLPKQIALRLGRPLVLLPQTYGPFEHDSHRNTASAVIAGARSAWARDARSFAAMRAVLGDRFDPRRHREGVDVAFALPASTPSDCVREIASHQRAGEVVVGVNVSGLIANEQPAATAQFGLTVDYLALVHRVARQLLDGVADRLVLVPHVVGDGPESDVRACRRVAEALAEPDRVSILPPTLTASETKWCIAQFDWFCGTRMHSTVAALSSGVPAASIAYSLKTQGVFETCGMGHAVVDARSTSTDDAVDRLVELATRRLDERALLASRYRGVVDRAQGQFAEILDDLDASGAPV